MTEGAAARSRDRRRTPALPFPFRLDLLVNPYGPSLYVNEALASADDLHLPSPAAEMQLRERIASALGVPSTWIALANGIDDLLAATLRLTHGEIVIFPPTDADHERIATPTGRPVISVPRGARFDVTIDPTLPKYPTGTTSLVQSPNDPTGTILIAADAVRLSRKSALLIVDERHAAYSPRVLLPLAREFENIVIARTFETWAGLRAFPFAYAITRPKLAAAIEANRQRRELARSAVLAANATFDDLSMVYATVERVREEKARLYRTLRKLNMLAPHPSWANFILTTIERGDPSAYEHALLNRGIRVHRPVQSGLERTFRISATSAEATTEFKNVMIDVAANL